MANAIYPKYKQALLTADANIDMEAGNVKVILFDATDQAYNSAHVFRSELTAGAVIATSGNLTTKSVTNGTFDADNVTFTAVTGDQSEALIIFIDTGANSTSRLVAWIDTGVTGLPVTPNGGDITVTWDAAGIFTL